jgi:hypothetical protein
LVRERRLPERYTPSNFHSNFSLSIIDDDPRTIREVVDSKYGYLSKKSMDEEISSLDKNDAWVLVDLSTGRNPIDNKWVFKKKLNVEGKVDKYKARFVEKGYSKVDRIDFGEIFSLVSKLTSRRFMLFVVEFYFQVEKMDLKITLLHGDME